MKQILFSILTLFTCQAIQAQQLPVIIEGATIHIGNGNVIEKGFLVMWGGKIVSCDTKQTTMYKTARVIQAEGKHVYPGIICMNTLLGLNEIDAVRATRDYQEAGSLNPDVRSLIAYNTDSKIIPTVRYNGVLLVQAVPQGGLISGQSSLMKTDGWNWEDAQYKADDGIHLNWPEPYVETGWWAEQGDVRKQKTEKELQQLASFFEEAERYSRISKPEVVNLRLEAMRAVFGSTKNLYLHVNTAKGIAGALTFFKKYPTIKVVLVGANDAYKVPELIRERNIPVVLNPSHRLPQKSYDDIAQPYKTAAQLTKAGITVAIGHPGSWEARNVVFNAGTAVAYGLSREEALMLITRNPARIMGIENKVGTLEQGKDAFVIISSGDVLDMRTNNIEHAFMNGEEIRLSNQQNELYQKYLNKYNIK